MYFRFICSHRSHLSVIPFNLNFSWQDLDPLFFLLSVTISKMVVGYYLVDVMMHTIVVSV